MKLPSAQEYLHIVQTKAWGSLATLNHHHFVSTDEGKTYLHEISSNTIVFKTEFKGKFYAIRFFLHDDPDLFRRYAEIESFLRTRTFSWSVPFELLDKEYYPAIKMDWVDSLSFSEYLDSIISNPELISRLQLQLVALSQSLESSGIGHGNLNLKHIRLVKQEQEHVLKLIDYDSMFIPAFKERDSLRVGTIGFQHPMRLASDFSETIDRFSFWIFLTALEAFKTDPSLWINSDENGYDKSKQIFFTYQDFAFPQQSGAFKILAGYHNKALDFYTDKLMQFCHSNSLEKIEAVQLYGSNSSLLKKNEEIFQQPKTEIPPPQLVTSRQSSPPVQNIPVAEKKPVLKKTKTEAETTAIKNKEFIHLKVQEKGKPLAPVQRNKKTKTIISIAVLAVLIFTSVYFVKQNKAVSTSENKVEPKREIVTPNKVVTPVQQPAAPTEAAFTSANINQFLSQLYASYNKRDLSLILSNYAGNLLQYYDAGAISKEKLSDVISNLFIKPAYYECSPNLQSIQFSPQGDTCRITVTINEIIKADNRSKKEKYSSTIEYTIDRSFKILAEKNVG